MDLIKFNEKELTWSSQKTTSKYSERDSVGEILFKALTSLEPTKVLQINETEGRNFTVKDVIEMSKKLANHLLSMNLQQTDVIGIMAAGSSYVMPLSYAALFIGVPFQCIEVSLDMDSVLHLWNITKPKVIFCDGSVYDLVNDVVNQLQLNCKILTLNSHVDGVKSIEMVLENTSLNFQPSQIDDLNKTALLCCSSGSSGPQKAVCWSHNFIKKYCFPLLQYTSSDIVLNVFSLFWSVGIREYLSAAINNATLLVSSRSFDPCEMLRLIEKYKVTRVLLVPLYAAQMVSCKEIETTDLSSLEIVQYTGAKMSLEVKKRLEKYLSPSCVIKSSYGCSEMSGMAYELQESSFVLHPNIVARIKCPETNKSLTVNEEGEIELFYETPWAGYYNDRKSTNQVYKNGWYKTGDLGHFNSNGFLHINSRIKEIIRLELCDISPLEIEAVILEMPDVILAVVVGIPDELKWNLLAVLVIKKVDSPLTEDDVIGKVALSKPSYKHINGGVFFVETVPTTPNGKINRRLATEVGIKLFNERNKC